MQLSKEKKTDMKKGFTWDGRLLQDEESRYDIDISYPWHIFQNSSCFKSYWDLIIIILIIAIVFILPFELCFTKIENISHYYLWFHKFTGFCFIFDILLNMRCTYIDPETHDQIYDSFRMFKHYVCTKYFIIDVLSGIPYEFFNLDL